MSGSSLAAGLGRARAKPLRRLDSRLVVGVLLVVVSITGGLALFSAADYTVPVLSASRDLPAGHVITGRDLRVTRVRADAGVLAGLVRGSQRDATVGRVLLASITRDGLLASAALGRDAAAGREMTVPITPEHALGGALRIGDHVDVLATFNKGAKDARTLTVVHDAQVVDAVRTKGILGEHAGDLSALTLSVQPDDAVYLAFA
jgi:Flp pilus assembly protein CpaB